MVNTTKRMTKHESLFSGIGGFDLASEWMGWDNVFHCEWNEFGQKILKYYWPNAISYGDITKTDFTIHRGSIDVLTGGFPCQPYSVAGKRKGKEDARHLWPEMLRAIREIKPVWIVGENVPGLINWNRGMVFNEVQTDLEAEGYEVQPVLLPACGVNAPHKRERVWFVAHSESARDNGIRQLSNIEREGNKEKNGTGFRDKSNHNGKIQPTTNPDNDGSHGTKNGQSNRKGNDCNKAGTDTIKQFTGCSCETIVTDTESGRMEGNRANRKQEPQTQAKEGLFGCNGSGNFWKKWPTQPSICSRNDGLSSRLDGITFSKWRNESIKAFGNAIVPQVAYEIFKAIEQIHDKTREQL